MAGRYPLDVSTMIGWVGDYALTGDGSSVEEVDREVGPGTADRLMLREPGLDQATHQYAYRHAVEPGTRSQGRRDIQGETGDDALPGRRPFGRP